MGIEELPIGWEWIKTNYIDPDKGKKRVRLILEEEEFLTLKRTEKSIEQVLGTVADTHRLRREDMSMDLKKEGGKNLLIYIYKPSKETVTYDSAI